MWQSALGKFYHGGLGVKQDDKEAAQWFRKAADQGDAESQFALSVMYSTGIVFKKDEVEGEAWLRKAADQGYTAAAQMLYTAELRKKGEHGDLHAQYTLCKMYDFGQWVESNKAEAYFWISLAASKDATYSLLRDTIGFTLKDEQLTAEKKRAGEWKPTSASSAVTPKP